MKPTPHFLQTKAWAAFQEALGRKVITSEGKGWHWQAIVERGRLGTRLYCPYGPTASSAEALEEALKTLKNTARQVGAVFVRVEPVAPVDEKGMRRLRALPAPREIQPHHTWRVDLTQPEDELIANMNATNRNLHRTAGKKGITFRKSNDPKDVHILLGFIHEVARRTGIRPHSDEYFRIQTETLLPLGVAHLFFALSEDTPVAAALVYDSDTMRLYAHAGSSFAHRRLHAGTPLVSHMMMDAKKSGLSLFDFNGVAPSDQPNHPWAGFTSFKQSFGGYQVDFTGTWDIPLKSLQYRIYRTALKVAQVKKPSRVK